MEIWTGGDAQALVWLLEKRKERVCGIDCETEGIDPKKEPAAGPKGRIVCWTLSFDDTDAFIWHSPQTTAVLAPVLKSLPVVGHNIWGFDAHMFRKSGLPLGNVVADTMRQHKLINPSEEASHGLKTLMKYWLGIEPVGSFEELFMRHKCLETVEGGDLKDSKRKVGDFVRVPSIVGGAHSRIGSIMETVPLSIIPTEYPHLLPILIKYAKLDSRATLELYRRFNDKLEGTPWEVPLTRLASK